MKHIYIGHFFQKVIINFVFFTFCILHAFGQQNNYFSNIQYLTSDDGLSQNEITSIIQDQKGFVWIGTRAGLNRYDGTSFKEFQNEIGNPNSLINNSIETLFEDSEGVIWIGTKSNGISKYNPELGSFENIRSYSEVPGINPDLRVLSICEGTNGNIWFGTYKNGLFIYNKESGKVEQIFDSPLIYNLHKSTNGFIWAATSRGAIKFDLNGVFIKQYKTGNTSSIQEDALTGTLYFVTWGKGLIVLDTSTDVFRELSIKDSESSNNLEDNAYSLYLDAQRNLWIGTWGYGLYKFDIKTEAFSKFDLTPNEKNKGTELYKDVISIFQDNSGLLWFGTDGGGVAKVDYSSNQFAFLKGNLTDAALPSEPIRFIAEDNNGGFYVGVKGNNNLYYSEKNSTFEILKTPIINGKKRRNGKLAIRALYQDNTANIWLADNAYLYHFDKKTKSLKQVNVRNQKNNKIWGLNKLTALFQASDGVFWIGTQQYGVKKSIARGNPFNQTFKTILRNDRISVFVEDKKKNLWIGTYNGLVKYIPNLDSYTRYTKDPGAIATLSSNIVISMHEDNKGNLWVGTPNGLNMIQSQEDGQLKFKVYQVRDGLPNNYIHSILEDDEGNLWISTNKGISKFNVKKETFYNYDVNDGLQSNNFMENAAYKDSQGKMYFGGIKGINSFFPDSIATTTVPKVVLTEFKVSGQEVTSIKKFSNRKVLNKSIEYSDHITLKSSENIFSIAFAALDYRSASRYSYTYKMEGLDTDWNTATSQRNITYSKLRPGSYEFKVKVASDSYVSDNDVTSLKIEVLPPLWRTWPAMIFYVLVFAGLLLLYRYFINKQHELRHKLNLAKINQKRDEEMADMKTRFFTNVAHEIRTPLSLISGPLEILIEDGVNEDQKKSYLNTIHYHTKRLSGLVGQLLDFRKSESGKMTLQVVNSDFSKFVKEIYLSFKDLAESKGISFDLIMKDADIPLVFDRNKMEVVLFNLLSNAFKYTNNHIQLRVSLERESIDHSSSNEAFTSYCKIEVIDNGTGMSQEVMERIFDRFYQLANIESINLIGTGIGLALTKDIVELHHGSVEVSSEKGKGSVFVVKIPLGADHFSKEQFIKDFKKAEDPSHYQINQLPINSELIDLPQKSSQELLTLLIVEDNLEIRTFVKAVFSSDYNVIEAVNGRDALKVISKTPPDLIISDLMMPEMDGLSFCKILRSQESTLHIPLIMLTARTAALVEEKGYDSGVDIFVTKPFSPKVLRAQVESLLNSRKYLREYFNKTISLFKTEDQIPSLDEKFLKRLMKLVESNLTNNELNREFLASSMALSPSTLYRKVKSITGLNITVFIRSIRLKKAAQMIADNEDTISGIAYTVGFNDPKYFRKCFVKQFGVNPSQFNKSRPEQVK